MYIFIIITSSLLLCSADDHCVLQYEEQPLTDLECSPYTFSTSPPTWILKTSCAATLNNGSFDSFVLYWYRKSNNDSTIENLGQGIRSGTQLSQRIVLDEIPFLNNASFSEDMTGEYWCQAVAINTSGDYLFPKSNVLTVYGPSNYTTLNVCVGVISNSTSECVTTYSISSDTLLNPYQANSSQNSKIKLRFHVCNCMLLLKKTIEVYKCFRWFSLM